MAGASGVLRQMKLTERDRHFERRLAQELRLHAAFSQQYRLRTPRPTYRAAAGRGGRPPAIRWGLFGKAAAGLVAVGLALGGGAAAAMATTGSANPIDVGQHVVQIVEGCRDSARPTKCVSDSISHPQNGELQLYHGASTQAGAGSSPDQHLDHGQGNGAGSASEHGRAGTQHGNGDGGGQGDHDRKPPHTPGT